MGLARSSYYYQSEAPAEDDLAAQVDLRDRIEAICAEFPRYGYRRVTTQLKCEGWVVNHKRVARIMREEALTVRSLKRFTVTTDSRHGLPVFSNRLAEATLSGPDQAWQADITYIRIATGFVFLAVILDAWSRRVVGYALSKRIDTQLTLSALQAAIASRQPPPGCIHHSDRGVQYAAQLYRDALAAAGLIGSMSRKGNPYDNALAESFMKTLKHEEVYLNDYRTHQDVLDHVPEFIEAVYNTKRLHSALGYQSPKEFESHASQAA
jgi:putative transposase